MPETRKIEKSNAHMDDEANRLAELSLVLSQPSRESTKTPWTPKQVKELFYAYGIAFSAWETHFEFSPGYSSRMLNVVQKAVRGETHKAAVLLGLKIGTIVESNKERREKMAVVLGTAVKAELEFTVKKK